MPSTLHRYGLRKKRRRRHRRHGHARPVPRVRDARRPPTYGGKPVPPPPGTPKPPPTPRPGPKPPPPPDASHRNAERLLWRAGFGPRPGDVEHVVSIGIPAAVRELVHPSGAATLVGPAPRDEDGDTLAPEDAWGHDHLWWLDRMVRSNQPLVERMTLIWHDWFATSNEKVGSQRQMLAQNETIRSNALGSFADLLTALTQDPAMLVWRDALRLCLENEFHASFFVTKLWGYFVPTPPDQATQAALQKLYVDSGYGIAPVVEAILKHPALYADRALVKPPVVFNAGLLRMIGRGIDTTSWSWLADHAGQHLFQPPNVSGWDDASWLDTSTWRGRSLMVTYALRPTRIDPWGDEKYDATEDAPTALARALKFTGDPTLTPETRKGLLAFASSCLPTSME